MSYIFQNPADAYRSQSKAAALGQFNPRAQFISKALHANINLTGSDLDNITAFSSGGSPTMMPTKRHLPDGIHGYGAHPVLTARPMRGLGAVIPKKIYIRQLAGYGGRPGITARRLRGLGQGDVQGPGLTPAPTGTVYGGQIVTAPDATVVQDVVTGYVTDTSTGNVYDASGALVAQGQAAMPTQGSGSPIAAAYQNVLTSAQNSQNPLDYVSPQSAIAAGIPAANVNAAWSAQMAKYPSTTAAIAAGIPAGVVTQLWAQSRQYAAKAPTNWFSQVTGGIPNSWLVLGVGGIFLVAMLGGSQGYRRH